MKKKYFNIIGILFMSVSLSSCDNYAEMNLTTFFREVYKVEINLQDFKILSDFRDFGNENIGQSVISLQIKNNKVNNVFHDVSYLKDLTSIGNTFNGLYNCKISENGDKIIFLHLTMRDNPVTYLINLSKHFKVENIESLKYMVLQFEKNRKVILYDENSKILVFSQSN